MKKIIATLGIAGTLMGGGIDASSLHEVPMEKVEMVASERLEVKQRGNVVETKLPWKGEQGITVKYDMGEPTSKERLKDKRNKQVITEVVDFGEGGFKIDIILDEKPDTNRFCYQIEGAENYDFFYQPKLTEKEIAEGNSRPDDIIGSYAVYHKTLKNNGYKTGKVMHIPRPQVWEVNDESTKEWAELSYTDGELCVTARQEFLDTATYPVRIDPTFGYTSIGASASQIFAFTTSNRWGQQVDAGTDSGTITKITAAVAMSAARNVKTAIGEDDGSQYTPVTYVEAALPNNSSVKTWYDWTYSYTMGQQAANNIYGLFILGSGTGGGTTGTIAYDSTTGFYHNTNGVTYSANTDPLSTSGSTGRLYSIYATYTASGGGAPSITSDLIIFE